MGPTLKSRKNFGILIQIATEDLEINMGKEKSYLDFKVGPIGEATLFQQQNQLLRDPYVKKGSSVIKTLKQMVQTQRLKFRNGNCMNGWGF